MADAIHVEALVIGAGPGGYVAGIRLGQLKKRFNCSSQAGTVSCSRT